MRKQFLLQFSLCCCWYCARMERCIEFFKSAISPINPVSNLSIKLSWSYLVIFFSSRNSQGKFKEFQNTVAIIFPFTFKDTILFVRSFLACSGVFKKRRKNVLEFRLKKGQISQTKVLSVAIKNYAFVTSIWLFPIYA